MEAMLSNNRALAPHEEEKTWRQLRQTKENRGDETKEDEVKERQEWKKEKSEPQAVPLKDCVWGSAGRSSRNYKNDDRFLTCCVADACRRDFRHQRVLKSAKGMCGALSFFMKLTATLGAEPGTLLQPERK